MAKARNAVGSSLVTGAGAKPVDDEPFLDPDHEEILGEDPELSGEPGPVSPGSVSVGSAGTALSGTQAGIADLAAGATLTATLAGTQIMQMIEIPSRRVESFSLQLPMLPLDASDTSFTSYHLNLRMTIGQAKTLRGIYQGLNEMHARKADGKHVDSMQDAVKWILDQVADMFDGTVRRAE